MVKDENPIAALRKALMWLVAATVVLYFALGFIAVHNYKEAQNTTDALCKFTNDLQNRADSTKQFLQHPETFPAFNKPAILTLTKQQLANEEQTLQSLDILNC